MNKIQRGNTQNRQQIATILQSMGFETDDISRAFTIFEKSYGDEKYDVSVLTEIVFEVQQQNEQQNEHKMDIHNQSRSAPNSPNIQKQPQPQPPPQKPILHYNKFQPVNTNKTATNNQKNDNQTLSIFNSLQMDSKNIIKSSHSMTASPHLHSQSHKNKDRSLNIAKSGNLMECLTSFEKYTNDESETIDVLLQTLNDPNNDVFDNMVNWNELNKNIQQRKREWIQFEQQFNSCIILKDFDEKKHENIKQFIAKKLKKSKNYKMTLETPRSSNKESMLQKALKYEFDSKHFELLNKKDKLLMTASTYSILKNNKEKTDKLISKCNEKMESLNRQIAELQNEKKQYFSALMRTKNKLLFQIQSIRETETAIKELHEETNKIQSEMESIKKTKECVDKFEHSLHGISNLMHLNFGKRLEPLWSGWSNDEVVIWIKVNVLIFYAFFQKFQTRETWKDRDQIELTKDGCLPMIKNKIIYIQKNGYFMDTYGGTTKISKGR